MSDPWSKVSPGRRSFLQKLVGATFAVPLLSSFSMSGTSEARADKGASGTIGKAEIDVEFKTGKPSDASAGGSRVKAPGLAPFENKNKTTDAAGLATKKGGAAFENKNKTTDAAGRPLVPFKVGKPSDDSAGKGSKAIVTPAPAGTSTTSVPTTGTR